MTNTANPATPSKGGTRRANALASGCMLDEYRIDAILGAGGFGVTYKAWDTHLETSVAIKEYFPVEWSYRDADGVTVHSNTQGGGVGGNDERLSDYLWGLERFLDEARVLARVQHPFVVRVKRYFRAHGTAYIVMDYEEGEPLNAVLQEGETLDEGEVRGLLEDVLPALQAVHEQGFLHRDIKPSNLYVRAHDHRVILIDFGAAREAVGRHSKSVTSLVTPGYSPPEQYTTRNDRYGPWTDVYALGAVLYRCVTGQPPVEAAERLLEDSLEPAARVCAGRYGVRLLRAIDRALAVRPEQRFATVAEMRDALNEPPAPDEDDDETVLLGPWLKPGGGPAREPEAPRLIKSSAPAAAEPVADGDELRILPPLDANHLTAGRRLEVLRPPPNPDSTRRKASSQILVGAGLVLAALAVPTLVWLWPFSIEEQPPFRSGLDQGPPPAAISGSPVVAEAPVSVAPPVPVPGSATPEPGAGPSVAAAIPPPAAVTDSAGSTAGPAPMAEQPTVSPSATPAISAESPVSETALTGSSPVAPSGQPVPLPGTADAGSSPAPESSDPTARPEPVETQAIEGPPEPVTGTAGEFLTPEAAPAVKLQADKTAKPIAQGSVANRTGARPAKASKAPSRSARRQAGRRPAAPRPGTVEPEPSARERPASKTTVGNPWEPPVSTGFNQK